MTMSRSVYSVKLKDAIEDLRPAFRDVGHGLATLTKKKAELAPDFLKAYALWRRETRRPFIAFVQALDPTMPVANRTAYREHPSYRAAMYLKGLATNPEAAKRKGATPLHMLAVTIKSFLPLYGAQKDQQDALSVIFAATKWRDADQSRLRAAIRRVRPVGLPKVPRLVDAMKVTKAALLAFERDRVA